MGSSNRKKKEKLKDFQKPKLKVGKTKPKAANFTNTSFKSKAIVVATQSLHTSAPSVSYLFTHHLTLLKHHSSATRRESLSYLTTHLPNALAYASSKTSTSSNGVPPMSAIISALTPLMLDTSQLVRTHLLALFKLLPTSQVAMYIPKILLFVNSATTHITEEIRADSTKFLQWAIGVDPEGAFGGGGWGASLRGIAGCLGWNGAGVKAVVPKGKEMKVVMAHLEVLKYVLEKGLGSFDAEEEMEGVRGIWGDAEVYRLPDRSNTYAYLNLFGAPPASSGGGEFATGEPEDVDARRRYLTDGQGKNILALLSMGLASLKKDGGEVGRTAGKVLSYLLEMVEDKAVE
ncbi:uncharacterized protein H6S33_008338 [Morchella sextelata]|uniref:uncharacterized protein n=1 Tax=Morchella sextelata TaxID=1174677 RepID=UPI001D045147|nr:uncharacterized protein H6S33_008338 [Morchella sextelata]KAH0602688.1 hypothetical protein H6S33_008338 [Morchella sextelata]